MVGVFADVEVYAGRQGSEFGVDTGVGQHPLGGGGEGGALRVGGEVGSDVGDAAFADGAGDGRGLVVEPAVGLAVAHEDFGVGAGGGEELGPDFGGGGAPGADDGDGGIQCVILFDAAAEEGGEWAGLAFGGEAVVGVFHGGALGEDEVAAVVDVVDEVLGLLVGEEIERGRDDELVLRERDGGVDDVDGVGLGAEGSVVSDHVLDGVEGLVVALPVDGPEGVVGVEDGDVGLDGGSGEDGAGLGELSSYLRYFGVEGDGVAVGSDQCAVVLLLAVEGGAPLPVGDGVGTVADVVPGHGADAAFVEGVVVGRPVDGAGLGLHDPEVFAEEAAGEVVGGAVGDGVELAGADVVVP